TERRRPFARRDGGLPPGRLDRSGDGRFDRRAGLQEGEGAPHGRRTEQGTCSFLRAYLSGSLTVLGVHSAAASHVPGATKAHLGCVRSVARPARREGG